MMKTAPLTRKGFNIMDVNLPVCGDSDLLIKSAFCGICSGDLFAFSQRKSMEHSVVLGHEGAGIVTEIGKHVSGFEVGDRVTALGGAYAEYFTCRAEHCVKVDKSVPLPYALGEPIACCVHAVNRISVNANDTVALVGCGYMGLISLQLLKTRCPGARVHAIDPIEWRLDIAEMLGADLTCTPEEVPKSSSREQGDYSIVVETAGNQPALTLSGDLISQHGRLLIIGYHQSSGGIREVNMQQWNFKGIDVINGHVRRDAEKLEAMKQGVELLARGKLNPAPLVTPYPFESIAQAFDDLSNRKKNLFKAALDFQVNPL